MTQFTYDILSGSESTVGSIRYWVQHSQLAVDQILEQAQRYIFSKLRVREMRFGPTTVALSIDSLTATPPDGFQDPISFRLDGDADELDYVQENLLARQYDDDGVIAATGRPTRYALFGSTTLMQFDVQTDAAYTGRLVYYGTPDLISSTVASNFLSTRYPTLLLDTLIAYGYKARKRDLFTTQMKLVAMAIDDANVNDDLGRRGQLLR